MRAIKWRDRAERKLFEGDWLTYAAVCTPTRNNITN